MPKISVIVPIYKVEKYIHRCVDSILAQTFTDFELILVDDGSPDNCGKICDGYAEKDGRVIVIHQKNGGLSAARNTGIDWVFKNSVSEWICFVDSDDLINRIFLETLYCNALENNVKLSVCDYNKEYSIPNYYEVCDIQPTIIMQPEELYVKQKGSYIAWNKLYHKDCFENIRFPVNRIHEDVFVTHQIIFNCSLIAYIPSVLYYYMQLNNDSITNAVWSPKRIDELDAHKLQIDFFIKNGYFEALKWSLSVYGRICKEQYTKSVELFPKNKKLHKNLLNRYRQYFKIKKKYDKIDFNKEINWLETAYPKTMWLYWTYKGITSKFHKK